MMQVITENLARRAEGKKPAPEEVLWCWLQSGPDMRTKRTSLPARNQGPQARRESPGRLTGTAMRGYTTRARSGLSAPSP